MALRARRRQCPAVDTGPRASAIFRRASPNGSFLARTVSRAPVAQCCSTGARTGSDESGIRTTRAPRARLAARDRRRVVPDLRASRSGPAVHRHDRCRSGAERLRRSSNASARSRILAAGRCTRHRRTPFPTSRRSTTPAYGRSLRARQRRYRIERVNNDPLPHRASGSAHFTGLLQGCAAVIRGWRDWLLRCATAGRYGWLVSGRPRQRRRCWFGWRSATSCWLRRSRLGTDRRSLRLE